jgi:hypothetical protein
VVKEAQNTQSPKDFAREVLWLVCKHRQVVSVGIKLRKRLLTAFIQAGLVRAVLTVVRPELIDKLCHKGFLIRLEGSFHHVIEPVAHPRNDGSDIFGGPGMQPEHVVDGCSNVLSRIDEGSVEVKEV